MSERQNLRLSIMSLTRIWRRQSWLVIGLLWIIALVLGLTGFALNATSTGMSQSIFDMAYRTLQLIPMNSGDVVGAGWQLNTARFLIPFLTALTVVRTLLSLFRERWQQVLLRFWREHVIICGLSRRGWLLAQGFASRGDRVVVVEANGTHELISSCRERGMVVLVGDATDLDVLQRAGVPRAQHLVAVTNDDGVNAEIAVRVQDDLRTASQAGHNSPSQRSPLTCTVHLADPLLSELARTREMAMEEGVPFRLELFNVFERGARLLWSRFLPTKGGLEGFPQTGNGQSPECSTHVLVIGLGRLGEHLVVCAARDWYTRLHESPCRSTGQLRITVVDLEADWKCRALCLRYPQLAEVCDLVSFTMNVRSPEFYEATFLAGSADFPPADAVFVCFDNDSLGLRTGLAIRQRLLKMSANPTPVIVRMAEAGGLARLVVPDGAGDAIFADIHAFGLLENTCTPEAILGGTHEVIARWLHEVYVQQQQALGHSAATNPAILEWEHLPATLRESNRAEADALFRHLSALGYALIPLADWDAAFFRFSEPEIAILAETEHNRFMAERLRQGWRYTSGSKDIDALLSPTLVAWAELPEEERTKTCDTVRELPATLARAGFQIVRLLSTDQTRTASPPAKKND